MTYSETATVAMVVSEISDLDVNLRGHIDQEKSQIDSEMTELGDITQCN